MDLNGIVLVDKPSQWTSFDVVAKLRGILQRQAGHKVKVGHTGTLDPLATGLMVVVIGSYCKRAQEFSKLDKTYKVTMKLGETSDTGDEEGKKSLISTDKPSLSDIEAVLTGFIGESLQVPPSHSAIKVNGQRAYKLARQGKDVALEPRRIKINALDLTEYQYPHVEFTADVGSGTYIRSLVRDIGEQLATGAYMSGLQRTKVGKFKLTEPHINPGDTAFEDIKNILRGE